MNPRLKSLKQQKLDAELGDIIEDMGRVMWQADKEYIARNIGVLPITLSMRMVLNRFQDFCKKNYGK